MIFAESGERLLTEGGGALLTEDYPVPIVTSSVVEDRPQADGRRAIREKHDSDLGESYFVAYLAPAGADVTAILAARAAQLDADLAEGEHQRNLDAIGEGGDSPTFRYTTQAQFLARLKVIYTNATGLRACRIGRWFHLASLADATLRTLFGVTQVQVAGLRTKFSNQNALLVSVFNENGVYP